MDRGSLSLYGLSVISVLVVLILISASVLITNNAIDKNEEIVNGVMDSVNDFDDTATFDKTKYATITVHYSFEDNMITRTPYSVYVKIGDHYYIENPEVEGYELTQKIITGKAEGDLTFTVLYTPINV